ncbi:uncharacterized protein RHIMIDRAFT_292165 [Rhizopus microsporus ATCC 52813]|uniref:Uncharacterized protein n=1 Tax=Rhizopus microsporus ATCC 52813 TaxID=1340429 RepID=A0A2G4ST95_RHIZD|nr:uncharacterized protein RHIMIDRAFT_292165 [Rhizopus microsporus ATCC 52813]PHZ11989.1 hypothetical protein RHIMIDRAFT_292165 [Rhizopus microsporus ATCC 52813]
MGTDVSARFHEFQLSIKRKIDCKEHLTLEENVQHILALPPILLLKPARTHADLHEYISLNTFDALAAHILTSNSIAHHKFPAVTKAKLEQIVEEVAVVVSMASSMSNASSGTRSCSRLDASRQITALLKGDTMNSTNKILLTVRNMVETLPRRVFEKGPQKTELITRHFQSSLAPLFEDIDKDVIFRWTSVSDDDKPAMIRPDASINIVRALNHRLVGLDLVRVAHLAKIASDKHKARATFAFIVVGNHATFYLLCRAQYHLYTMSEVEHVQLPLALDEIPIFIAQLNKICNIIASFNYVLNCDSHDYGDHPPTLRDHLLLEAIDQRISRKRKSITSHYNH